MGWRGCLWASLGVLVLALGGCTGLSSLLAGEPPVWPGAETTQIGYDGTVVWQGDQAEVQGRRFAVARTDAEWRQLWMLTGQAPPGPLPGDLMAVGVFAGTRPTGGYRVVIDEIEVEQVTGERDRLIVSWREVAPPPDALVTQALTSPWTIRVLPWRDAEVRFRETG